MLAPRDGSTSSRKGQGGRLSLKDRQPLNRSPFPNIEQETYSAPLNADQRFEAALCQARNDWSVRNYKNSLAANRRLSRADAEKAFKVALIALADNQNRLAQYRRGGGQ